MSKTYQIKVFCEGEEIPLDISINWSARHLEKVVLPADMHLRLGNLIMAAIDQHASQPAALIAAIGQIRKP